MGDVVEDVRTVFEELRDETICIPTFAQENARSLSGLSAK